MYVIDHEREAAKAHAKALAEHGMSERFAEAEFPVILLDEEKGGMVEWEVIVRRKGAIRG